MAIFTFLLLAILTGGAPLEAQELKTVKYHGIRPDDPGGRNGLRNPERGWRNGTSVWAEPTGRKTGRPAYHLRGKVFPVYSDQWVALDASRYRPYGLTVVQTYCYLDDFPDRPISEEKLQALQRSLDALRKRGLKALLRFAYEKNMKREKGPTVDRILQHLDQLAPVIRKNADVIYVLQAGMVGAWGEWHSSANYIEEDHEALARIVAKELEILPENRMIQLRVPKYKRWVLEQKVLGGFMEVNEKNAFSGIPAARIGFANDGFLAGISDGGTWPESPFYRNSGNPEVDYMTRESAFVAVDGELFWGDQGIKNGKGIYDGLQAAVFMRRHHYTTFSLEHSYSGSEGRLLTIDRWMHAPITIEEVRRAKLPVSDGYFIDAMGDTMVRTQFEYITDHLGYRIELQEARFTARLRAGDTFKAKIRLINRGFSTFINPRPVYLTLMDIHGKLMKISVEADPRLWQPYTPGDPEYIPITHEITVNYTLPDDLAPGWYELGLWLPDEAESLQNDARYAVRVANRDVPWWTTADGEYGINLLGAIEITD